MDIKSFNKTSLFLIITFLICYGMSGAFYLSGFEYHGIPATVLAVIYMFVPMGTFFLIEKVIHKEKIKEKYLISFKINKWWFIAWFVPVIIAFGALGASLLLPDVSYSPSMEGMFKRFESTLSPEQIEETRFQMKMFPFHPVWIAVLQGLIAGATINAVAGFGEELGWRGFLLRRFRNMHFLKASLVIGFIWGIWHAPLILMGHNYPQHPVLGTVMMTVWCIVYTPLFLYFTIKAKSVILAAVLHGTLNATAGIPIMLVMGGEDWEAGLMGISGIAVILLAALLLFFLDGYILKEKIMQKEIRESIY